MFGDFICKGKDGGRAGDIDQHRLVGTQAWEVFLGHSVELKLVVDAFVPAFVRAAIFQFDDRVDFVRRTVDSRLEVVSVVAKLSNQYVVAPHAEQMVVVAKAQDARTDHDVVAVHGVGPVEAVHPVLPVGKRRVLEVGEVVVLGESDRFARS